MEGWNGESDQQIRRSSTSQWLPQNVLYPASGPRCLAKRRQKVNKLCRCETGRQTDEHLPCCCPAVSLCLISTMLSLMDLLSLCFSLSVCPLEASAAQLCVIDLPEHLKVSGQKVALSPLFLPQWGVYCVTGLAHWTSWLTVLFSARLAQWLSCDWR